MAAPSKGPIALSVLIIAVGVGWLLTAQGFGGPGINWVWILGLAVAGVLAFVASGGVDKFSIVAGPFLLIGSLLSVLRQAERLSTDLEVPILVISIGVLLLVAQLRVVPLPRWYQPEEKPAS